MTFEKLKEEFVSFRKETAHSLQVNSGIRTNLNEAEKLRDKLKLDREMMDREREQVGSLFTETPLSEMLYIRLPVIRRFVHPSPTSIPSLFRPLKPIIRFRWMMPFVTPSKSIASVFGALLPINTESSTSPCPPFILIPSPVCGE